MSRSRFMFTGLLVVLLLALGASIQIAGAQGQPVFRIGVLDNERGPITNGARLAVREINAAGGVRGADGTFFRLELVIQPTSFGANLEDAVANLGQASTIAVLGPLSDSEVLNGLPLLQNLNVPILTPATDDTIIVSDTSGRILRSRAQQVLQGQALARHLIEDAALTDIAAVQLDLESTDRLVGFNEAARALGVSLSYYLLEAEVSTLAGELLRADPQVTAAFGSAALASELYTTLRAAGWTGLFAYDRLDEPGFRDSVPFDELVGVVSTTTWSYALPDAASDAFLGSFVRAFGAVPGPVEAAAYDSVNLIAEAIGLPGELLLNLTSLADVGGVQGPLMPSQTPLRPGELSNNVNVVRLGEFGAPEVVTRFAGSERVPADLGTVAVAATPTPAATATPEGVVITIVSERQNIRSGPGTAYDIIGQAQRGEQFQVIGANRDNTWAVISFRGRQGWLSVSIADVFGNLNTVSLVDPPPTPTPGFTPTPPPPQEADIVIDSAVAIPSPIRPGQPFNVNVTVRNAGNSPAGQFAVAATFPPNNVYSATLVPGLAPGQSTTAVLTGTLANTGFYSVVIVADLNNEVPEGPGEGNNNFTFSYAIDKPIISQGQRTLNPGDGLDLEGNGLQADVVWNANGQQLDVIGSARLGLIGNVSFDTAHWDLINPTIVNQTTIFRGQMNAGTIVGVITADGNRAVIRVDDIPGNQFAITFKVYQN